MKILKPGKPKIMYIITCSNCECEFVIEDYEFNKKDNILYYKCPWCSKELKIGKQSNCEYRGIYHY